MAVSKLWVLSFRARLLLLGAVLALLTTSTARAAEPHRSIGALPSSNGRAAIAFDTNAFKLTQFLEHPYRYPSAGVESRNFLYDAYPGLRVGTTGAWLNTITPSKIEYVPGTGIIHVVRSWQGLTVEEFDFAPMGLAENAAFTVLKVTRQSGSGAIDAYTLMNYHLGSGSPAPSSTAEGMAYNAGRDAYYEWGPSGVAFGHASIAASTHHGATPNNPYTRLVNGQNLADDAGPGSPTNDAVCGFQSSLGDIAQNATAYAGWFSVLAADADAQAAVDRVRTWIAGRAPDKILADEIAAWSAWQKPAPQGTTAVEAADAAQAQAVLRMAQVAAGDKSDGQILASIAPGKWNIAWVRDMAYATVALARSGHLAEAKRAIDFQMKATVGGYESYVGAPYQISVVRYYGDGTEESDTNQDGPNVEFDGFGLFLWELAEYVQASNDTAALTAWWPTVQSKVADVLAGLQEPSGLIAPDSSIWEVHWNGQQKHFAYTTITAARGLCAAAGLATQMNDAADSAKYLTAGEKARDAILGLLRAPDGTIGQATESLAADKAWLDAAAVEAINFGLFDPAKHTARATVHAMQAGLVPPSGRGFMRNDSGGWYDSQEWVFVDLRAGHALELTGATQAATDGLAWNVDQAAENFGLFSELHDRVTADYAGEAPMVGFGAGAYLLSLLDRGEPVTPSCGAFAAEPDEPGDAGADAATPDAGDAGPMDDAGGGADAGASTPPGNDGGCSIGTGAASPSGALAILLLGVLLVLRRARRRAGIVAATAAVSLALFGCSSNPDTPPGADAGGDGQTPIDAGADVPLPPPVDVDAGACTTTFRYVPAAGTIPKSVSVAGEWDGFQSPGAVMTGPDGSGAFTAKVPLSPGLYAYKLVVDGNWQFDPASTTRKFVGGTENSSVQVTDCYAPSLALKTHSLTRQAPGQGRYQATVDFLPGWAQTGVDPATVKGTLRKDFADGDAPAQVDAVGDTIAFDLQNLADGKYTLFVDAKDRLGRAAPTLRLVFWVEAETFDWHDALIYMAVTDRFKNGDTSNDVPPVQGVDVRANFQNGDLEGVQQAIAAGDLDKLGVRAIWLTPFYTATPDAFPAADGVTQVTGYHGYWPIKAREVDPRLGGDAGLKAMVKTAHEHGIRVIMDLMLGDVHKDHEYVKAHPDWFIQGCVCGTNNCDWTTHRLDCVFASYLPRVDWTKPEVSAQWTDDAVWWASTYDLDGYRIDAVKHLQDAAVMNVSTRLRHEFEASGTKFFLTGETAMGWSDCGLACNQDQYDTISRYIGPYQLDGQFDFVLYHAVSYRVFDYGQKGMIHADYWAQASGWEYPQGAIMSPYIGSQDTARDVTLADYRGQDQAHDMGIPGNQWTNVAQAPGDAEPYARHREALAWLLTQPGAPMLYYGDEYGEWGGADPNNRHMWRGEQTLSADEQATLDFTRKVGEARRDLVALRRGAYRHVYASDQVLVFARQAGSDVALVAINDTDGPQSLATALPVTLFLADGTHLKDKLGGPDVVVSGGAISLTLGARGAAILAP